MYLENIEVVLGKEPKISKMLDDYYLASLSRQLSLLGRREVHNGRAHFGIFGDGKEIVQLALAKNFRKGDWRSGYYRDQTLMLALGLLNPEEFFAMVYGDTSLVNNPSTGGRNFNNHFSTSNIDSEGRVSGHLNKINSASDISPTAGQMPRLLGLAQASKIARENKEIREKLAANSTGNEVAFGTIGDGSTSEGLFFETINAACVMQVPLAVVVYDDGYGISVPTKLQTAKASISKALKGFEADGKDKGCRIYHCHGWDYPTLVETFKKGIGECREKQIPVVFHIDELTQPTGHSTSGSHERYKDKDRLQWEKDYDALSRFRAYLLQSGIADQETLTDIEGRAEKRAREARDNAWEQFTGSYRIEVTELETIVKRIDESHVIRTNKINELRTIHQKVFPTRRSYLSFAKRTFFELNRVSGHDDLKQEINSWIRRFQKRSSVFYNGQLHREQPYSLLSIPAVEVVYAENPVMLNGSEIISRNFEALFRKHPTLITFGEDTGKLGDVNQGMKGMQEKYGADRVSDTGIREATIIGQGIGLALRGFKPIAEIQYLDYLIYALSQLSDDLATMHYRSLGRQIAPLIIRTRGHQLQGMWHAGSPMGMLLSSLRGIHICVPRDMTRAAGLYNTLLEADEPALVIEPLKGYNVKEPFPENIGEFRIKPGIAEIMTEGKDVTIVTYGWNVHHAVKAAYLLDEYGISAEVIDVQTLIPFDINHKILESVKKTNRILFVDEDVPGGATAYMLQKALDEQNIFDYLETAPRTLSAQEHRPAYGIDGEYFSKPNVELIFETIYHIMSDTDVKAFPPISFNTESVEI